jgi:FdhE protein
MDGATRRALADRCWQALLDARPDLGPAVHLQRALLGHVLDLADRYDREPPSRLSLPPRYVTTKLASGIPALTNEPIPVPVDVLKPLLVDLCRALAAGGGGEATARIVDAVEHQRLDLGALLALGLRREQGALKAVATHAGLGHDLLWLVIDLATGPFAHALLDGLFGAQPPGSPLRDALDRWPHGYCPLCGSWPTLVELTGGTRTLRCSFCAAAWQRAAGSCLYCGNDADTFRAVAPNPSQPGRTVELCGGCRGYAKCVPVEAPLPFPLVAIADLGSMDLDMAAIQAGLARPGMKQFRRR